MKPLEIKALREKMGLTQQDFSILVGVGCNTVNRWENGHVKPSRMAIKQMNTIIREMNERLRKHNLCL
jgi:DNA-binding transcriptional regulator YiaG